MDNKELISIIIPVYNIERYLPRCLETIAAQTYKKLEIILVDDGSTDDSREICDAFAEKDSRAIIVHQENQGPSVARNAGRKVAKGDYILFVDGDDYMRQNTVEIMYQAINKNKDYGFAMTSLSRTERLDENTDSIGVDFIQELNQEDLMAGLFGKVNNEQFVVQWNKLYRRELIEGILNNNNSIMCEDFDFNMQVFLKTRTAILISCSCFYYVQRKESITKRADGWDYYYCNMTELLYHNYIKISPISKKNYGHYLLKNLYIKMLFYKNCNYHKEGQQEVFANCRKYEVQTLHDYWLCHNIHPFEKIVIIFLLHNPRLTHWLMKVTKNG